MRLTVQRSTRMGEETRCRVEIDGRHFYVSCLVTPAAIRRRVGASVTATVTYLDRRGARTWRPMPDELKLEGNNRYCFRVSEPGARGCQLFEQQDEQGNVVRGIVCRRGAR